MERLPRDSDALDPAMEHFLIKLSLFLACSLTLSRYPTVSA